MCVEGRTNSAPLKGAQLNAVHDHFLPCSDWFGLSPRRERTRRFTVGSHGERVQNEVLSRGRHKRYTCRGVYLPDQLNSPSTLRAWRRSNVSRPSVKLLSTSASN